MIRAITVAGLKRRESVTVDLTRPTLVVGPVGAGKSRLAEALRFAAAGIANDRGDTLAATGLLMVGDEIVVDLHLDDDRLVSRRLVRKGAGFTELATASWLPMDTKPEETATAIRGLFGDSDETARQNQQIMRLTDATGPAIARAIEALLETGGMTPEQQIAMATDLLWASLKDSQPKVDRVLQPLSAAQTAAAMAVVALLPERIRAGLATAIAWAKEAKATAVADSKEGVAARGAMEARLAEIGNVVESATVLRATRDRLAATRAGDQRSLDVYRDGAKARADAQAAVETAATALEAAKVDVQPSQPLRDEALSITDPPIPARPFPAAQDAGRLAAATQLDLDAIKWDGMADAAVIPVAMNADAESFVAKRASDDLALAQQSPWREVEQIARKIDGESDHPVHAPPFKAQTDRLLALAAANGSDVAALTKRLNDATAALETQNAAVTERGAAIKAATYRRDENRKSAVKARNDAKEIRDSVKALADQATADAQTAWESQTFILRNTVAGNLAKRAELNATAATLDAQRVKAAKALADAESAHAAAVAKLAGLSEAAPLNEIETVGAITKADADLVDLDAKLSKLERFAALEREMRLLVEKITTADADKDAYDSAVFALTRVRDRDIADRAEGFTGVMRRFLVAAGRTEDPYISCKKGAASFGWNDRGQLVDVSALSKGQAVIFRAAFAYAVLMARRPAERVLFVEFAHVCDGVTEQALLAALLSVAGDVQVIAETCVPIAIPDGWNVVRVDAKEAAHAA